MIVAAQVPHNYPGTCWGSPSGSAGKGRRAQQKMAAKTSHKEQDKYTGRNNDGTDAKQKMEGIQAVMERWRETDAWVGAFWVLVNVNLNPTR